jgi:hypothetical protein
LIIQLRTRTTEMQKARDAVHGIDRRENLHAADQVGDADIDVGDEGSAGDLRVCFIILSISMSSKYLV